MVVGQGAVQHILVDDRHELLLQQLAGQIGQRHVPAMGHRMRIVRFHVAGLRMDQLR